MKCSSSDHKGKSICYTDEVMKIGIQGVKHSYHHQAAKLFFSDISDDDITQAEDFTELFELLENGSIDIAVCAVENTIYGGINEVYDLLASHESVWIGGEQYLPIHHCLAAPAGATLHTIKDVYSHPAALGQCKKFITKTVPSATLHNWRDTAAAAIHVAEKADISKAAICNVDAAKAAELSIIAENIEDNPLNMTRFLILYPSQIKSLSATKTSLMFDITHQPGALYDALGIFKSAGINLTMLVSRPIAEERWKYRFYIDLEIGADKQNFESAFAQLTKIGITIRVLGSYEKGN